MKVNGATQSKLVEIGETIRAAREQAGVSQAGLASKIGMHRENVIRLEKGRGNLTVETLMRVAEGLGVDLRVTFVRRPTKASATRKPGDSRQQVPVAAESKPRTSTRRSRARRAAR